MVLIDTKTPCGCTKLSTKSKTFDVSTTTLLEAEIKTAKTDSDQILTFSLTFASADDPTTPVAYAHLAAVVHVRSECSFSSSPLELRFDSASSTASMFAANFGPRKWTNLRCFTDDDSLDTKCFLFDDSIVEDEQRQTAKIVFLPKEGRTISELKEVVAVRLFAEYDASRSAMVEIAKVDARLNNPKQFEVLPRQLSVSPDDEFLFFFAISNDESLAIADWNCFIESQLTKTEIPNSSERVSPR